MEGLTIEEYMRLLKEIEDNLLYMEAKKANELLEQMFAFKPVRLKWYLVKAKVMFKQGKSVRCILDFLSDKCQPWYLYDGVNEYFQLLSELNELDGDIWESKRQKYLLNRLKEFSGAGSTENKWIDDRMNFLLCQAVQSETIEKNVWDQLTELSYISGNIYLYILIQLAVNSLYPQTAQKIRIVIMEKYNVEYYYERLANDKMETFALLEETAADEDICLLMAKALMILGKKVIILKAPVLWRGENLHQSMELSENAVKWCGRCGTIQTFYLGQSAKADNRGEVLNLAVQKYASEELLTVLSTGYLIDEIAIRNEYKPKMERLTDAEGDYLQDRIAVARYGNYLSFVANIFKTSKQELEQLLYEKPACMFSIIIPCRNADEMLVSTLKTCLNQTFQGEYEIVISDNSEADWGDDTPTRRICEQFQDERIKYYRAPRNLSLSKSFEFAYLHARGEFLLSVGADDGILPHALNLLYECVQNYPQFPIFLWNEASYKWAGLKKGCYKTTGAELFVKFENKRNVYKYKSMEMFAQTFLEYGNIYYLPMLYHNSGLRRSYMRKIYEKTGALWGGSCQDVNMAVILACIEEEMCFIDCVLTITAISTASIGINCTIGNDSLDQMDIFRREKNTGYHGVRVQGYYERLIPHTFGTDSVLYSCILYAYAIGVITDEMLDTFDWKEMYRKVATQIFRTDILYDAQIHRIRYAVSLHSSEMLEWFDKTLYHDFMQPMKLNAQVDAASENEIGEYVEILGKKMDVAPGTISDVYQVSVYLQNLFDGKIKE